MLGQCPIERWKCIWAKKRTKKTTPNQHSANFDFKTFLEENQRYTRSSMLHLVRMNDDIICLLEYNTHYNSLYFLCWCSLLAIRPHNSLSSAIYVDLKFVTILFNFLTFPHCTAILHSIPPTFFVTLSIWNASSQQSTRDDLMISNKISRVPK